MDRIYLIIFDNGMEYSDSEVTTITSCGSEEEAKKIVKDLYDWALQAIPKMPSPPLGRGKVRFEECSEEYQKAWEEYAKVREALWATCPHGGEDIGWKAIEYIPREKQYDESNEAFYYVECPYVEAN
jgi:hypothetical protein